MKIITKDENNIIVDGQKLIASNIGLLKDCQKCYLHNKCLENKFPLVNCYTWSRSDNKNVIFIKK